MHKRIYLFQISIFGTLVQANAKSIKCVEWPQMNYSSFVLILIKTMQHIKKYFCLLMMVHLLYVLEQLLESKAHPDSDNHKPNHMTQFLAHTYSMGDTSTHLISSNTYN